MKEYDMKKIRNLLFIGSSGAGKTTLAEQIFFLTHSSTRLGKIDEGNTLMDFDPEEAAKKMSLGLSIGFANYKDHKINLLDAPGYPDFIGDAIGAIPAAENAIIVANATGGYEVGLELAIEQIEHRKMGKIILVNRMDNEHADYDKTLEAIAENTGIKPIKLHIPIGKEGTFEGVVDVIRNKAIKAGGETDVPANLTNAVEEARLHLMEAEFSETKIPIDIRVDPQNLELSCDERLINQVLINLLGNSAQSLAGKSNARISMSAYFENNEVIVQIKDNGPGIPEEIIDKIFIPFYSTKENGSGVGLSLSKQIMRLHNGSISVYSKPDEETIFTLRF